MEEKFDIAKVLMTPSCTQALEMAAILIDIVPGDEVIMPSYTFVSTANAFVLRGAKIVFVDIRPDTMNLDEELIESAITERTRAIVPVHYAGVSCEMDRIMSIADKYGLFVIEDAAQGVMSTYNNRFLGSFGHMAAYSFHETKNYTSGGEGGALLINDERFIKRAEVIREKGTNRSQFFRGMVDKYSWVDAGSSFLPSELQAAYLYSQLKEAEKVNDQRMVLWERYFNGIYPLTKSIGLELPTVPPHCKHNAHMFYIKTRSLHERTKLLKYLSEVEIKAAFHYVPLHSSHGGLKFSRFNGLDNHTTQESDKLLRLPMWYGLPVNKQSIVIEALLDFYK